MQKKLLTLLVLLMTAVTGAMATTVTWVTTDFYNTSRDTFTKYDVTVTTTNQARMSNYFYDSGVNTFTTTLGNFTKIEIVFTTISSPLTISGWNYEVIEAVQPYPEDDPEYWKYTSKLTWTGDAGSVSIQGNVNNIQSITFTIADAPAGPAESIDLTTTDNLTWTLASMPEYNLELEVEYYPLATLATTPAAAEGLNDATTADLLTPGTSTEGTLYYALGTSEAPTGQWSQTIPTTEGLEAGEYYVWYKVVGDAEHSDSQPQSIAVTVAQAPAFAVTIDDAGVDASNWQATPAEQQAGQTVTLSYSGKKTVKSITIEAAPITVTGNSSNDTYKIDAVYNLSTIDGQSDNKNLSIADAASLPLTKKLSEMDPNGLTLAQQGFTAASITVSGDNIVLGTEDGWNTQIMFNGAGTATVSYNIMYTNTMQVGTGFLAFTVTKNEAAEPETPAATTVTVTPTANANEWEFTMPDHAVVAKIEYYTDAELAAEETVILADGDTYTRTLDMTVASATYKKSIAEDRVGLHQAWLVPFDYTLTNNDMENFSFYKINMIANAPNPETEASDDIWVFLKRMEAGDVLHANMPYVYRAKSAVDNYEFTTAGAMLKAKTTDARITMMTAEDTYSLYGTYEGTTATAEDPFYYVNIDGDLSLGNDGSVTVGAFRWIMRVESKFGPTPAYARNVHFFDGEDSETTGISEERRVKSEEFATAEGWFTLDGRRVAQPKKGGLYIVNGKKVVIK